LFCSATAGKKTTPEIIIQLWCLYIAASFFKTFTPLQEAKTKYAQEVTVFTPVSLFVCEDDYHMLPVFW